MADAHGEVAVSAGPDAPVAMFKRRGAMAKKNTRKRLTAPALSQSEDSSDDSAYEDDFGRSIKKRKKNTGTVTASSAQNRSTNTELAASTFTADRSIPISTSKDATKTSNWFDEDSNDTRPSGQAARATQEGSQRPEGTYKGLANQPKFIQKNPNAPTRSMGPVKASGTTVRTTITTDYAPDVCKDYKQTGWCGFGDSCIFLHDRGDYKQGWQLDREWENVTKGKKLAGTVVSSANRSKADEADEDDEALLESIPFACIICKEDYKNPIVTKCGHYFCESCALGRYRRDPSCAACGAGTNGVFNNAKKLKKLLERKRERELRADADVSDGEG